MNAPPLLLSPEDRSRVEHIEELARAGAGGLRPLLALLDVPSWAVRRAVVSALASLGDLAVSALVEVLIGARDQEARLAGAVDALAASSGAIVDTAMIDLARADVPPPVVCDAVQVLGRRRAHRATALLATLSRHEDDNVAVGAIEALGRVGGVETVDALVVAVETRHFFRTFPAIDALGRTGDSRAIPALAALVADPLYAVEAIRALGRTGHPTAIPPLAAVLERTSVSLVRTATVALAEIRERYESVFGTNEAIVSALPATIEPSAVSRRILDTIPGAGPTELVAIARVLGWLGDDASIAQLLELVMSDEPVGSAAADALRRLGSRAAAHVLAAIQNGDSGHRLRLLPLVGYVAGATGHILVCLDDLESEVRARACDALARLGDAGAVSSLFRLIGDRDGRVSQAAAAAIQSLGSLDTKRIALEQARSDDARTRRAAMRIIAYFGYPEGLSVLIAAMSEDDEKIREAAIAGIPLIDDPQGTSALLAAVNHPSEKTRAAVVRALGQTSAAPSVIAALRAAVTDPADWVRYYACQALGRLHVEAAAPELVASMDDATGQVRVAAVEALAHLRADVARQALAAAARSTDADMKRAALVGLGISRVADAVPLLRRAASDDDPATRLVAVGALAEFDSGDVVPTLAHAASDPDESVRSAAISYLSTRPTPDATAALLEVLRKGVDRNRAMEALALAADQRVDTVSTELETADAEYASLLVGVLTRMRRPSGQAALAAALLFDNVHARRAAAAALAALGSAEARDVLARAGAVDPDPDVRRICTTVAHT